MVTSPSTAGYPTVPYGTKHSKKLWNKAKKLHNGPDKKSPLNKKSKTATLRLFVPEEEGVWILKANGVAVDTRGIKALAVFERYE